MFKLKTKQTSEIPAVAPEVLEQIRVMPQLYYKNRKKREGSKIFIWLAVVIAATGVAVAGFILVSNYLKVQLEVPAAGNLPIPEASLPAEPVVNEDVKVVPMPEAEVEAEPAVAGTEDGDVDGLTLDEEKLYLTNSLNSDTDGDGYSDGAEVLAGYDPSQPGRTLAESGLIKIYNNPNQGYLVMLPQEWLVNSLDTESREVVFDSRLGEFIRIFAKANPDLLSLSDWISVNDLLVEVGQLAPVTINNLAGYKTADDLKYYLASTDLSTVFVVSYEAVGMTEVSFRTTMKMMARSFKNF